jgi:pilus assembly protein CpaF
VLQLSRLSDGSRRLVRVYEITGMEGDVVTMQEVFKFQRLSTDPDGKIHGEFRATGIRPKFIGEFKTRGIKLDDNMFSPDHQLG